VLAQAAGFALVAAILPAALLAMAVFLGSDNPRRTALLYLVGAMVMTLVMALTVLLVLRATHLNQPRQHAPRYGLRLGLGILALALAGLLTWRRKRHGPGPGPDGADGKQKKPGFMDRLLARPRPVVAFLVGLVMFAPSPSFIAAVQVIATADASIWLTVAAMAIVITLTMLLVWLPLIAYFAAPEATTRALHRANAWLAVHGHAVLVCCFAVAGLVLVLVVNGALGLSR
jgi:threonine/homoserine/homoserine lactone efflux protein